MLEVEGKYLRDQIFLECSFLSFKLAKLWNFNIFQQEHYKRDAEESTWQWKRGNISKPTTKMALKDVKQWRFVVAAFGWIFFTVWSWKMDELIDFSPVLLQEHDKETCSNFELLKKYQQTRPLNKAAMGVFWNVFIRLSAFGTRNWINGSEVSETFYKSMIWKIANNRLRKFN